MTEHNTHNGNYSKSAQFFKLTADRVRQDYQDGGITAEYYILYLIDIHSFGDIGWTLDVVDATSKWGIPKRTYYRAIEKLKSSGKIKISIDNTRVIRAGNFEEYTQPDTPASFEYLEFLKSDYWKNVRQSVLERDSFTCQQCQSRNSLQVHHLTYKNHRREHQHLDDLITLCSSCHSEIHGY